MFLSLEIEENMFQQKQFFLYLFGEGRLWVGMSTSLAINYFPHSQKQEVSSIAKNGLSVGKPEFWEDLKKKKVSKTKHNCLV